jgi:hypothetical protein
MKGAILVAENINGRELGAIAHRLCIIKNDVFGDSGCSLLDGRIGFDRFERNAGKRASGMAHLVLQTRSAARDYHDDARI